jgi:Ca2+:H+ antiporter
VTADTRRTGDRPAGSGRATAAEAARRSDRRLVLACAIATATAAAARYLPLGDVVPFLVSAVALAALARLVGRAVDALGDRLGPGAIGVLQSALGNLPELFVCLFALRSGLYDVVRGAIVGSILANVLLVLGLALTVGGLRHGRQYFASQRARSITLMLTLSVTAMAIPSLTAALHTPAVSHERALSTITSVLLLVLFALSVPASVRDERPPAGTGDAGDTDAGDAAGWPLRTAVIALTAAGVVAAAVSDWFVAALEPAMSAAHVSQSFAGLVVVAIAGNAVENVVGIQLAGRNQADHALSIILQSPVQIALVLAPVLVLVAPLVGATFTLVLPPLLLVALFVAALVAVLVVVDGESTWLEGATLVVLYILIAAAFWWG